MKFFNQFAGLDKKNGYDMIENRYKSVEYKFKPTEKNSLVVTIE